MTCFRVTLNDCLLLFSYIFYFVLSALVIILGTQAACQLGLIVILDIVSNYSFGAGTRSALATTQALRVLLTMI